MPAPVPEPILEPAANEDRTLVLAPHGRDAQTIARVLSRNSVATTSCHDISALLAELEKGAAAALITEEALRGVNLSPLIAWLARQPPWSDFPFVLMLSSRRTSPRTEAALALLEIHCNVILLERPLNAETLWRATLSAMRARRRQYQTRDMLVERLRDEEQLQESQFALQDLNETLESRILERTEALSLANNRLMGEISERERTQAVLAQAQKMEAIGQLTGGIAHDFNNLLHVIAGNIELIGRITGDERIKQYVDTARKATARGAKLTGQLLAFARNQRLDLKPVDLARSIRGLNELLSVSVGSKIEVRFDFPEHMPAAMADVNQIEMAVLNLAINARDAMPDGGTLTLKGSVRDAEPAGLEMSRYVVLSVTDTGTGIKPEHIAKVFEPFFTTKGVGKGTGLGLSQVYGIARQSGGTARVLSELGRGTTVEIWLPLATELPVEELAPEEWDETITGGAKILVVEDDPQVRRFLVQSLEILGYQVREAEDGTAGLAQIAKERPDLLIVDYLMPGMSGAEVVARVTASSPDLPIIVATGYADMRVIDRVIGKNSILKKPFQINDLAKSVRTALSSKLH